MVATIKPDEGDAWEGNEGAVAPETFSLMNLLARHESLARDFASAASSVRMMTDLDEAEESVQRSSGKWHFFQRGRRSPS
ncbi:MAG TPA: hypothetical protein DCW68_05480 [Rhodospirillaceae bacterium]|nr:MAG: hypothetical protein A2018_02170 [Alphaproteobacteria bacterium GWF2_58_20]HAU29547.1 hypothetical protein [Rhodospirillaceae bacterium]